MKKYLLLLGLVPCLLISCQKEISSPILTPIPPVVAGDSTLIRLIVGLDTTKSAPFDTVYKSTLYYDNLKRTSNYYLMDFNNTGVVVDTFVNTKYLYAGTDTLPFKSTTITHDASIYMDTDYLTFSAPPRNLIYDSTLNKDTNPSYPDINGDVRKYSYHPNSISLSDLTYTNGIYQGITTYSVWQTKSNGNVISQIDTLPYGVIENFSQTFDTKPNPLNLHFQEPNLFFGTDYLIVPSVNNCTEMNSTSTDNSGTVQVQHYKYFYSYNSLGYPIEARVLNVGSTTPRPINKIKYFYTK